MSGICKMNCTLCDRPVYTIDGGFYELANLGHYRQGSVHPITAEFKEHRCEETAVIRLVELYQ